ncbi:10480_t:CDS:1, partial [Ambispora gerdemannii]
NKRAVYIQQIRIEYEVLHSVSDTNSTISQITSQKESSAMGALFAKKNAIIHPSVKEEFEKYLKIPELPALEKNDPIIWWRANKSEYPILSQLACKYLTIPATSVPSECLFSDMGNLITSKQN